MKTLLKIIACLLVASPVWAQGGGALTRAGSTAIGTITGVTAGTGLTGGGTTGTVTLSSVVAPVVIADSTITWTAGNVFTKTLGANQRFVFTGQTSGQVINVKVLNTASNWTVTWVSSVTWKDGSAPTQTTGAKSDIYTFFDIGGTIYGAVSQNY